MAFLRSSWQWTINIDAPVLTIRNRGGHTEVALSTPSAEHLTAASLHSELKLVQLHQLLSTNRCIRAARSVNKRRNLLHAKYFHTHNNSLGTVQVKVWALCS